MRCVTKSAERQVKFEKDPETGSVRKVIFITHKQKCSDAPNTLKLEAEEGSCECKIVEEPEQENKEEETTIETIKEVFDRYMKK